MTGPVETVPTFAGHPIRGIGGRRRRSGGLPTLSRVALVLAVVVAVSGCGPSGEELAEVFDKMDIPDRWVLVSEELVDPPCLGNVTDYCPIAERIYEAPAGPEYEAEALAMLEAAAFHTRTRPRLCETGERGCIVSGMSHNRYVDATIMDVQDGMMTIKVRVSPL